MINVTKPFLPPQEEYTKYVTGIWERNWLTNNGPLVVDLEEKLKSYLDLKHLLFLNNGTIPLQFAIRALGLKGEIITTPFSYVATTGCILWEGCTPVFADVEDKTYCIDADQIEAKITKNTSAILATHVYGFPCDVLKIEAIAKKHNLKVIYDGAHAFGVKIKGESIFKFGDISTCSFHATKLFHTIEGGAIFSSHAGLIEKISLYRSFGHIGDDYIDVGINGKNSEFHAAMGLCNLPRVDRFISQRKNISDLYTSQLKHLPLSFPVIPKDITYNYSYYPIVFRTEEEMLRVKDYLATNGINTRRYFYPSLNNLPYLKTTSACPVSDSVSKRVLCLPFYQQLSEEEVFLICSKIKSVLQ